MSFKSVIIIIAVVLLLILGGWYLYSVGNRELQNTAEDSTASIEASLQTGPSDQDPNEEFNNLNQSVQDF